MKSKLILIAVMLLLGTGLSFGQKEKMRTDDGPYPHSRNYHLMSDKHHGPKIPDMTEEQETQMKTLHLEMGKFMLPIKNELKEKEARLNSLKTAEKVDMAAINDQIEAIGALKIKMEKKHAEHEQDVRKMLTEEQRLHFDMHIGQKGNFHKKEMMMKKKHHFRH
ncbi:MAG: periplasmic heavy metal sensor [Bacteroidota bacterium]|nr:periplasmic heavy metal sensor [Bacteroidota bacterium]